MRFRVKNIRPGYCEVWANERDGQRYQLLAVVMRDDDMSWRWSARHNDSPFHMPFYTYGFATRRDAVRGCERAALRRLLERAIQQQPKESPHWHSPRRDALCEVRRSGLFTLAELYEIEKRLTTFEEE